MEFLLIIIIGIIGMIVGALLTVAIFGFGMVKKSKYRKEGLL